MVHDQIQLAIKEVRRVEEKLKETKKDLKSEEKIEDDRYSDLKIGLKQMRIEVKEFEEDHLQDLKESDFYNQLRENKMKAEEELAHAKEKLFKLLEKVPLKPFKIDAKEEEGPVKIEALPEMKVFVNGKEIKK